MSLNDFDGAVKFYKKAYSRSKEFLNTLNSCPLSIEQIKTNLCQMATALSNLKMYSQGLLIIE